MLAQNGVVENVAVIKTFSIKRLHCIFNFQSFYLEALTCYSVIYTIDRQSPIVSNHMSNALGNKELYIYLH